MNESMIEASSKEQKVTSFTNFAILSLAEQSLNGELLPALRVLVSVIYLV